jgi:adenylate cyclase
MNATKNKITFEVQILQNGQWETHASYPGDQQGQAIQDAKALEKISTVTSVKVTREEINSLSGSTTENSIFASANLPDEHQPKGKVEARKAKAAGGGAPKKKPAPEKKKTGKKPPPKPSTNMRAGADIPDEIHTFDPHEEEKPSFSMLGLLVKLLLVIAFSAIIASLLTGLAGVWLRESSFGNNTQSNILFGLFVASFAISIFSMGMSFLSKAKLGIGGKPRSQKAAEPGKVKTAKAKAKAQKDPLPSKFRDEAEKSAQEHKDEAEDNDSKEEAQVEEPQEKADDSDPEPGSEIGADVQEGVNGPWVKKQQKFIMDYLLAALEEGEVDKSKLDNFNKFGINLFIAGACETLSQEHNLDGKTVSLVISEPVKYMGFKRRDAESFADRIQGYLLADSKYMQAYQAGRSAMKGHLEEDPDAAKYLKSALEEWNKPKEKGESTGPVTVLFTDIAGSTNMTQTLGDAVAQQVVRAHNKIVREALAKFNGKEIKHTGDGIMASFSTSSNGVEAAADMQMGTVKHNVNNPDLILGLKIGLNAGEPIAEDNDLFGTTVQLAARIVDKAQAAQIFVSDTVFGICGGKNYTFIKRGPYEMKGFEGGLQLYEFVWDKDAKLPEPDPVPTPEATPSEDIPVEEKTEAVEVEISAQVKEPEPAVEEEPAIVETTPAAEPETPAENPETPPDAPDSLETPVEEVVAPPPATESATETPSATPEQSKPEGDANT